MDIHLLRFIRKHGAEKIISDDYLNVLSNSLYGDFDRMGKETLLPRRVNK